MVRIFTLISSCEMADMAVYVCGEVLITFLAHSGPEYPFLHAQTLGWIQRLP